MTLDETFDIHVSHISGNEIRGYINTKDTVRVYAFQHATQIIKTESIKSSAKYLFSLIPGMAFSIPFSLESVSQLPYVAIYAESFSSGSSSVVNYRIPEHIISCNKNDLSILSVTDNQDSCVNISVQYKGDGELFLLSQQSVLVAPTADCIIQNGVYLGM